MLLLAVVALAIQPGPEGVADSATFKDGRSLLGQVVEPPGRGRPMLRMAVRRQWARDHFPDRYPEWEAAERPSIDLALKQRLERLRGWRAELGDGEGDPLVAVLNSEIERLTRPADPSPLMIARLDARELDGLTRRPEAVARRLRQGWQAGLDGVESMELDRLADALASRGVSAESIDPAPIVAMLPPSPESDRQWSARRAATEARHDPSLRHIRFGSLVLPEAADPDAATNPAAPMLTDALQQLLADPTAPAPDPMEAVGQRASSRSRRGLMVTELVMTSDLDRVTVTTTLYARTRPDLWEPFLRRSSTVKTTEAPAPGRIAADPRVESLFRILGSMAPESARSRSLVVGSATRLALDRAREAIEPEIDGLSLSP